MKNGTKWILFEIRGEKESSIGSGTLAEMARLRTWVAGVDAYVAVNAKSGNKLRFERRTEPLPLPKKYSYNEEERKDKAFVRRCSEISSRPKDSMMVLLGRSGMVPSYRMDSGG